MVGTWCSIREAQDYLEAGVGEQRRVGIAMSDVNTAYASSGIWKAVHVGQFACTAILLAGLVALPFALTGQAGTRWAGGFGAASAVVALAL
jgi:hypothetical protein